MPWAKNLVRKPLKPGDSCLLLRDTTRKRWVIARSSYTFRFCHGLLSAGPVTVTKIASNGMIFVRRQI